VKYAYIRDHAKITDYINCRAIKRRHPQVSLKYIQGNALVFTTTKQLSESAN